MGWEHHTPNSPVYRNNLASPAAGFIENTYCVHTAPENRDVIRCKTFTQFCTYSTYSLNTYSVVGTVPRRKQ